MKTIMGRHEDINTFADFVEQIKALGLYNAYYSGCCFFIKVENGKIIDSQAFTTCMNSDVIKELYGGNGMEQEG